MDLEPAGDIEVDICTNCKGIWLDGGELDALMGTTPADFDPSAPDKVMKAMERDSVMKKNKRRR